MADILPEALKAAGTEGVVVNHCEKSIPTINFNPDEWHADETVAKIGGKKYYLWLILDSETLFVLGSIWTATGTVPRLSPY